MGFQQIVQFFFKFHNMKVAAPFFNKAIRKISVIHRDQTMDGYKL